ncbi:hypothetical protein [Amycolatopsis sp. NBC_01480]|uniref:hypothetical protein n=1 Tax=Amycolatopsis sp. NBC_01480 TaxID=2903562 RepID=UPI002E2E7390|nr:hypothetical protein [Amycolatopsis sp. NBC_01480]
MDDYTRQQIAAKEELERIAQEKYRDEQARMVAAVALENAEKARQHAEEVARQRREAEAHHNQAQGFKDNWK